MADLVTVFRLGVKELRSFWSDRGLVGFVVLAFSFMIYSAATSASLELHNAPIALVDGDRSTLSTRIAAAFDRPHFLPPELVTSAEVDPGLDAGRWTFVLDVPPHFERDVRAGHRPTLQVNIDATRMSQAYVGAGYIAAIVTAEVDEFATHVRGERPLPVGLVTHAMFNQNLTGLWFGGVMELIEQITMLSIILTGAALLREREHGTIEHLLVMPLRPVDIMAAKVWANGLVVLVATACSLQVVVRGVLGVPVVGSVALFLVGTAVYLFSTTSMGILLATVARSMPQMGLLLILVILPLHLLSGAVSPRESMPAAVQSAMLVAPTTHFVALAQAILYRGAGLDVVWPQLAAMAAIGAAFFGAALALFRRSLAATG